MFFFRLKKDATANCPNLYSQIFTLLHLPYIKRDANTFAKKNKKESFADKTTFNSHTFYKMNGFTTTINATTRSLAIFYVNPCS